MSGYCTKCGCYELTATKIDYYLRRVDLEYSTFRELFEIGGFKVLKDGGNYCHVIITPSQLWEYLSGMNSNSSYPVSTQSSCPYCK